MAIPTELSKLLTKREQKIVSTGHFHKNESPMLATLSKKRFYSSEWLYEMKWDGVRILAFKNGKVTNIFTRNNINVNKTYPEIVEALKNLSVKKFILDGEIVIFKEGISRFSLLQQRLGIKDILQQTIASGKKEPLPVHCCVFDILNFEGANVKSLPLVTRKRIMSNFFMFNDPIKYTEEEQYSENNFKKLCSKGCEGLIAKRKDSIYENRRSKNWLKFKCSSGQELIIIGYTKPKGSRVMFGALLLGYYKNNKLHYAGKVGTGFKRETLITLKAKMDKYISLATALNEQDVPKKDVVWLLPALVGEFAFSEWTTAGRLRHGRFLGLREDKPAREVVKEE